MPTDIRIIHAQDFIKVDPQGNLDLEDSKRVLLEIASASASLVDYEVIVDTRKSQSVMSVIDLWYLAAELEKFRASLSSKIAVLCPLENFDHAGFFALCAKNRGFRISAFTSFEDAVHWLIGEPDT